MTPIEQAAMGMIIKNNNNNNINNNCYNNFNNT